MTAAHHREKGIVGFAGDLILGALEDMRWEEPPDPGERPLKAENPAGWTTWRHQKERRRSWLSKRASATVWLSTTAAVKWFEMAGLDQSATLWARGWRDHAADVLRNGHLTTNQRAVLETGIRHCAETARRRRRYE